VIQNPSAGTAILSGALTGSGGLTFSGIGTTVLTGTNTYQGGTTVASGTIQGSTSSLQGSITNNGKLVFDQTGAGTFSGTIAGSGTVVLQNSGTVVLSGNNSYTGGTTVSGGTLSVAGTTPTGTGDVEISSPATMMGTGSIAGNVVVRGTLKPGNSPGYLAAGSNVTLNTGATYQQDIAGIRQASSTSPTGATGYYSFMTVDNQFIINAGTTLAPMLQNLFQTTESGFGSAPYVPNLGDSFRIVTAAGGISGMFSTVTQPAGLASGKAFITFYNYAGSRSIDLMIIPSSYTSTLVSSSSNVQSTATVLDKLSAAQMTGQATMTQSNLMYVAASQTAVSLPSFAQALTGETYGAALAVVPQAALRVQNAVLSRIDDNQMGISSLNTGPVLSSSGITPQNPLGQPNASTSSNPEVDPSKDSLIAYRPNVWGELAYQHGSRSSDANASGFNSNLYQTVFGHDIYQNNSVKVGAGFALSTTGVSNTSGNATVGQGSIFLYGKMPVMNDYVLDAIANVGVHSTRVTRTDPTSSNNLNTNNIMGNDLLVSAGISRPITLNDYNVTVTPYARVTWQMVNQSAFDEGATSAASLSVNSYTGNGVRGLIGISAGSQAKDPMTEPYTYKVNLAVGTDTNTLINPTLNANLASYGTTIQTPQVGNTFVQAGLYGSVKLSDNSYAYAGITGETRSGQTLGVVTLGLKVQF
jgi:outer membrane autotransporter protein